MARRRLTDPSISKKTGKPKRARVPFDVQYDALDTYLREQHEKTGRPLPVYENTPTARLRPPDADSILKEWNELLAKEDQAAIQRYVPFVGAINLREISRQANINKKTFASDAPAKFRIRVLQTYAKVGAEPLKVVAARRCTYADLLDRVSEIAASGTNPRIRQLDARLLRSMLKKWMVAHGITKNNDPKMDAPLGAEILRSYKSSLKVAKNRLAATLRPATIAKFSTMMDAIAAVAAALDRERQNVTLSFGERLRALMQEQHVTASSLSRDAEKDGISLRVATISAWTLDQTQPRADRKQQVAWLAKRFGVPIDYLLDGIGKDMRVTPLIRMPDWLRAFPKNLFNTVARELPEDFLTRRRLPDGELEGADELDARQRETVEWIRKHFCETAESTFKRNQYGLGLHRADGPSQLKEEFDFLVRFRNDQMPPRIPGVGARMKRIKKSKISSELDQRVEPVDLTTLSGWRETVGFIFGALALPLDGDEEMCGRGLSAEDASLALLLDDKIIEWYCRWRAAGRAGASMDDSDLEAKLHYSFTEVTTVSFVKNLFLPDIGYLTQRPDLLERFLDGNGELKPGLRGIMDPEIVARAKSDWVGACVKAYEAYSELQAHLTQAAMPVRDRWLPILPILEADRPLEVYYRFALHIRDNAPSEGATEFQKARHKRDYLIIRLAIETGFRQENLRELTWDQLVYDDRDRVWRITLQPSCFKNDYAKHLAGEDYVLVLHDELDLYADLHEYKEKWHRILLKGYAGAKDNIVLPAVRRFAFGTKLTRIRRRFQWSDVALPEMNENEFYVSWKRILRKYGIYNKYKNTGFFQPMTMRVGEHQEVFYVRLHGPHDIRDIIVTDCAKALVPIEHAAARIQDSTETLKDHYRRWGPKDNQRLAQMVYVQRLNTIAGAIKGQVEHG